ncbi:MAG: NAD(P)-dependent oxidoreductase [archaeon]
MKFIMTGHKGLIGHFLLERLKAQGHEPVLLIDTRDGEDIKDIQKHKLTEPVDMLIHLASFCKINKIVESPDLGLQNNVIGTHEVMEFCRKNKIPKVVFTSSSRILSKEKNAYTASKIFGEEMVKGYSDSYGIDYVIIRPSTVYGPFNDLTKRLIDIYILNALQNKELKIYGDPETKNLDFTYIDDFVDATLLAMEQTNKEYDISGEQPTLLKDVANQIIQLAGKGKIAICPAEIAQPQVVALDISPLKAIGYDPKVSLEEGVKRTFEFYKENLDEILKSRNS